MQKIRFIGLEFLFYYFLNEFLEADGDLRCEAKGLRGLLGQ